MPRPRATRASSTEARSRLPKRVRDRINCSPIVSSPQTTMISSRVAAKPDAHHVDLPLQPAGHTREHLPRAHHVVHRRHRHEDEADREQHLIEMRLAIDVHVQGPLQHEAQHGAEQERRVATPRRTESPAG
jgi:hypothetical protein